VELESAIDPATHPALFTLLLDLFREEENYLLRGEAQYRFRVNELVLHHKSS
jgi:hypothetical protein